MLLYFIFSDVFPWLVPEEGNDGDSNALMYFFLGYLWTVVTKLLHILGSSFCKGSSAVECFSQIPPDRSDWACPAEGGGCTISCAPFVQTCKGVCGGHWLWTDVPNCSYWPLNVTVCFSFLSDQKCFKLRKTSWRCLCFFHRQLCSWNPSQYRQD